MADRGRRFTNSWMQLSSPSHAGPAGTFAHVDLRAPNDEQRPDSSRSSSPGRPLGGVHYSVAARRPAGDRVEPPCAKAFQGHMKGTTDFLARADNGPVEDSRRSDRAPSVQKPPAGGLTRTRPPSAHKAAEFSLRFKQFRKAQAASPPAAAAFLLTKPRARDVRAGGLFSCIRRQGLQQRAK